MQQATEQNDEESVIGQINVLHDFNVADQPGRTVDADVVAKINAQRLESENTKCPMLPARNPADDHTGGGSPAVP